MFNFFKQKKMREFESLRQSRVLGLISHEVFLNKLRELDYDMWFNHLSEHEQKVVKLTLAYNTGAITKEEYAEKIKELDPDKWLSLLSGKERLIAELAVKLRRGEITKEEHIKETKTINGEPYITITNVTIETGQIGMEFDWNEHFIKELKDNGFTGQSDQDIVDQWFTSFATMVAAQSDKVIITDPDDIRKITKKSGKTEHF